MHNKLDTNINRNPNYNYEIMATLLQNAKNRHIPKRVTKFNKRQHKKQKWMTDELLAKIVIKKICDIVWKTTPVTDVNYERSKLRFKAYEKLVLTELKNCQKRIFW